MVGTDGFIGEGFPQQEELRLSLFDAVERLLSDERVNCVPKYRNLVVGGVLRRCLFVGKPFFRSSRSERPDRRQDLPDGLQVRLHLVETHAAVLANVKSDSARKGDHDRDVVGTRASGTERYECFQYKDEFLLLLQGRETVVQRLGCGGGYVQPE